MSGGVITTSSWAKALWPGVNFFYGQAYKEKPTQWTDLFETRKSEKNYEEVVSSSGFGLAPVKPEGAAISYDSNQQGFTTRVKHVTYALGFIVTKEAFEDDLYNVVAPKRAKQLAFSMRQTKEIVGANMYNRAFDSNYVYGDGVSIINASHPNVSGGTQSNRLAVDADLSEASLEQAYIDISFLKDDRGLLIAYRPESLHIHPSLEFEAARILKSVGRVGTDLNDINAIKEIGMFPKGVKINHYFTDPDAWFIRTDCPEGPIHFERRAESFDMDNDFETYNAKFRADARYSFVFGDYRSVFGSQGG